VLDGVGGHEPAAVGGVPADVERPEDVIHVTGVENVHARLDRGLAGLRAPRQLTQVSERDLGSIFAAEGGDDGRIPTPLAELVGRDGRLRHAGLNLSEELLSEDRVCAEDLHAVGVLAFGERHTDIERAVLSRKKDGLSDRFDLILHLFTHNNLLSRHLCRRIRLYNPRGPAPRNARARFRSNVL